MATWDRVILAKEVALLNSFGGPWAGGNGPQNLLVLEYPEGRARLEPVPQAGSVHVPLSPLLCDPPLRSQENQQRHPRRGVRAPTWEKGLGSLHTKGPQEGGRQGRVPGRPSPHPSRSPDFQTWTSVGVN